MTTIEAPDRQPATSVTIQQVTIQQQAPRLLSHIAGYVAHRTIAIGLRQGLIAAMAEAGDAMSADELAQRLHLDSFYVAVWCRAALASGLCDPAGADDSSGGGTNLGARLRLSPHVATLLLDTTHPSYQGGVFTVLEQPEVFDRFESSLATGERLWWDSCSPAWINGVARTGIPFYTRLAPGGLGSIPGLGNRLEQGCRIVDIACGSGIGLVHLAKVYPSCEIVGIDGDRYSIEEAGRRVAEAGLHDRCELVHSPLEEMVVDGSASCVLNNISMHECRDIDRVTDNVRAMLEPGGWFVISDFPYPDTVDGLRSTAGQVMSGIQYFEAQIDDQLLPRSAYDDLLARHGFTDLGHLELGGVHALTYGRVPA
jgi:ubiquinone/menaquinone biosynthesis C-methylase UbiE